VSSCALSIHQRHSYFPFPTNLHIYVLLDTFYNVWDVCCILFLLFPYLLNFQSNNHSFFLHFPNRLVLLNRLAKFQTNRITFIKIISNRIISIFNEIFVPFFCLYLICSLSSTGRLNFRPIALLFLKIILNRIISIFNETFVFFFCLYLICSLFSTGGPNFRSIGLLF
jgi:hypothetical protein